MTRKILVAVAMGGACAAFGCGSNGSTGTPTGGVVNPGSSSTPGQDLTSPPPDPNAPPPDPNAPPPDPNAPPPDPNAPPGSGVTTTSDFCSLCVGIDPACAAECASECRQVRPTTDIMGQTSLPPACTAAAQAWVNCLVAAGLVCNDGKLGLRQEGCEEQRHAVTDCINPNPPPPPGSGGRPNGGGGCDGSCAEYCAALDSSLPPSCADAVSSVKACFMSAGITCTGTTPQLTADGPCISELSALGSCSQTPQGSGGASF